MTNSSLALRVVNYTNERLKKWYNTVFEDFGVAGNGTVIFNEITEAIDFTFTERGITSTYSVPYWQEESIDYAFEVWAENAF